MNNITKVLESFYEFKQKEEKKLEEIKQKEKKLRENKKEISNNLEKRKNEILLLMKENNMDSILTKDGVEFTISKSRRAVEIIDEEKLKKNENFIKIEIMKSKIQAYAKEHDGKLPDGAEWKETENLIVKRHNLIE